MFFGIGSKWKNWKPTDEYLSVVKNYNTITKLQTLMGKFKYKWDKTKILFWEILWDSWQMPDESLAKMEGDCEDAAILAIDVLGRIQEREDARFMLVFGYREVDGKRKYDGHAITSFEDGNGKYNIFTNNKVEYGFKDLLSIGHKFYPLGLKYHEIRNWHGKVLSRKFRIFGTF